MFVALYAFENSFSNIVTITFSALICIEMLNVLSTVHLIKREMILSIILTTVVYFFTIITFRNYFETSYVDLNFLLKVILLSIVCWAPLHSLKKI